MRYFLNLAYDGTNFHGWQSQPNALSIQAAVELTLSTVFQEDITIIGAGRTDAGVHARQMYAHFDIRKEILDYKRVIKSINSIIGKDIVIKQIIKVSDNSHARFDAIERTYKYFITYHKNPFLNPYCWLSPTHLDLAAMNKAAESLLLHKDFTSFAKLHSDAKTNICDVRRALWLPIEEDAEALKFLGGLEGGIVFTISSDRFLRNMVRAIVGTIIEVGRHKISLDDFESIIQDRNRTSAGVSMPPNGLFLWNITYPFL